MSTHTMSIIRKKNDTGDCYLIVFNALVAAGQQWTPQVSIGAVPRGTHQEGWAHPLPPSTVAGRRAFRHHARAWWETFFSIEDYTLVRYQFVARHYYSFYKNLHNNLPHFLMLDFPVWTM